MKNNIIRINIQEKRIKMKFHIDKPEKTKLYILHIYILESDIENNNSANCWFADVGKIRINHCTKNKKDIVAFANLKQINNWITKVNNISNYLLSKEMKRCLNNENYMLNFILDFMEFEFYFYFK